MFRLYEWHVVLAFGFAGGVLTTLAAQRVLGLARRWLRIPALVLAVAGLQGCAVISPAAFAIRAVGTSAAVAHGAWRLHKVQHPRQQPASYPAGDCRR